MKEYSFTERKHESQYLASDSYIYFSEFSIDLSIDNLTEKEVSEIHEFIKNIAERPSAFDRCEIL
jgi:hypothetical protein